MVGNEFNNLSNKNNLEAVYSKLNEGFYLAGMAAGTSTLTNKIGLVVEFNFMTTHQNINSFYNGILETNKSAKLYVSYTNNFNSVSTAVNAAKSLIENEDVDVVAQNNYYREIGEEIEKQGKKWIGYGDIEMSMNYKNAFLAAPIYKLETFYNSTMSLISSKTYKTRGLLHSVGMAEDAIDIILSDLVDNSTKEKIIKKKRRNT